MAIKYFGSTSLNKLLNLIKTKLTEYEKSGVAETLIKDTVGWSGKNLYIGSPSFDGYTNIYSYTVDSETYNGHEVIYKSVAWNGVNKAFSLKGGKTYTFSAMVKCSESINYDVYIFGAGAEHSVISNVGTSWTKISKTFTQVSDSEVYIRVEKGEQNPNAILYLSEYQLEENDHATSYEPYHPTVDAVKADKVTNATSGHLAGLDSNGNLTDSGVSPTEEVTVEGNPVTFDSPFEQDAKSVVVSVKPIQDLHGYDHPWVGGAGKNKLPLTVDGIKAANSGVTWTGNSTTINGVTFTILTNNGSNVTGILVDGIPTDNIFHFYIAKDVTISSAMLFNWGHVTDWNDDHYICECTDGTTNYSPTILNGVEIPAETYNVRFGVASGTALDNIILYPMFRATTEPDATFAPYSNICPISGIDEVEIEVSGKNQFDGDWQYGLIDTTTGEVTPHMYVKYHDYIRVKPSTWYTMYAYNMHDLVNPFDIFGYDKNKHYVGLIPINIINNTTALFAEKFQIPSNVAFIRMHIADSTLGTSDKQQLEVGETYTEYEPYFSHTTTIPLPSTLYSGDVDVTNGVDTPTYGMVTDDDIDNVSQRVSGGGLYWTDIILAGAKAGGFAISSHLPFVSNVDIAWNMPVPCTSINNDGTIRIYINESTVGAIKAKLDDLQITYELATPETPISLTPAIIELLEGTNIVSTNGEKVAVTYKAGILATLGDIDDLNDKVKTKLDKKDVAKVEGTNASKSYAVGDYMLRADGFYRVTANISSGAAITNNNTTKVTVGGELSNKVNNDDSRLSDARTPTSHNHTGTSGTPSGTTTAVTSCSVTNSTLVITTGSVASSNHTHSTPVS